MAARNRYYITTHTPRVGTHEGVDIHFDAESGRFLIEVNGRVNAHTTLAAAKRQIGNRSVELSLTGIQQHYRDSPPRIYTLVIVGIEKAKTRFGSGYNYRTKKGDTTDAGQHALYRLTDDHKLRLSEITKKWDAEKERHRKAVDDFDTQYDAVLQEAGKLTIEDIITIREEKRRQMTEASGDVVFDKVEDDE